MFPISTTSFYWSILNIWIIHNHIRKKPLRALAESGIIIECNLIIDAIQWFFNRNRMDALRFWFFSELCLLAIYFDFLTRPTRQGGWRKERRGGRFAKMRENRERKKKRDRRSEEEESRYHNIAVIPGSVSFQIIQKPADRTYIPEPTRSSYRVIIVEGPNRPWIAEYPQWWSTSVGAAFVRINREFASARSNRTNNR